jgi:hypothetical protein
MTDTTAAIPDEMLAAAARLAFPAIWEASEADAARNPAGFPHPFDFFVEGIRVQLENGTFPEGAATRLAAALRQRGTELMEHAEELNEFRVNKFGSDPSAA